MSKVSIIVPYFKGPTYLEDCVDSVKNQGLSDYEIIVVNDKDGEDVPESVLSDEKVTVYNAMDEASDEEKKNNEAVGLDFYENRLQRFVEEKLAKIERKKGRIEKAEIKGDQILEFLTEEQLNPDEEVLYEEYREKIENVHPFGVSICRNIGMKKATGDYIYFLDCDDYCLEGSIGKLLALAEEKNAMLTTGNKYSSWFRPISFDFEKANQLTFLEGITKLEKKELEKRFDSMFSVQHILFNRQFLTDNSFIFDNTNKFYSDYEFVIKAITLAKDSFYADADSIYVCRRRNDKIHRPSLSQQKKTRRGREYLSSYQNALKLLGEKDETLRFLMEKQFVIFFIGHFGGQIIDTNAVDFTKESRKLTCYSKIKKQIGMLNRLELVFLKKQKYRMVNPVIKVKTFKRKKKGLFGSRIQWMRILEKHIFKKMSIRTDWVLCESFFGKSYSDSPKYLYEYLQKTRGDKYRYIWSLNQKSEFLKKSGKATVCKRNSLRYMYYSARAGYRIFNVRQPGWMKKRPGVVFLETWHGTPLKKLVFDLEDIHSASQNHKNMFYKQDREWNYLVSANRFSTDVFERAFAYNRDKILEYGYPRNDILYAKNRDEIAAEVKKELGIPEGKRVILYAPTWRDDQFFESGKYKFTLAMDLDRLRKEIGDDSVILLRTHYYIANILDLTPYEGFVYNGSQYEDISRLYLISDICITDYSSVFFDYANLYRPILFFAYDYDDYADKIRGLYIDMDKELPGPILRTNDELVDALKNMDAVNEKYAERYKEFYDRFCSVDDGKACERIIEEVFGTRERMAQENSEN